MKRVIFCLIAVAFVSSAARVLSAERARESEIAQVKEITEITMAKVPGGPGITISPPDSITLRSNDGAVDFGTLARWLLRKGFFEMRTSDVDPAGSDGGWLLITATRRGKSKVLRYYPGAETDFAWEAEMLIRGVAAHAQRTRYEFDEEQRVLKGRQSPDSK